MTESESLELFRRIIIIETKLNATLDRLKDLLDAAESQNEALFGSNEVEGLLPRVNNLEKFHGQIKWMVSIVYGALVMIGTKLFIGTKT